MGLYQSYPSNEINNKPLKLFKKMRSVKIWKTMNTNFTLPVVRIGALKMRIMLTFKVSTTHLAK